MFAGQLFAGPPFAWPRLAGQLLVGPATEGQALPVGIALRSPPTLPSPALIVPGIEIQHRSPSQPGLTPQGITVIEPDRRIGGLHLFSALLSILIMAGFSVLIGMHKC
jgi:hypothetical protein